jgi:hypothetical protein
VRQRTTQQGRVGKAMAEPQLQQIQRVGGQLPST